VSDSQSEGLEFESPAAHEISNDFLTCYTRKQTHNHFVKINLTTRFASVCMTTGERRSKLTRL